MMETQKETIMWRERIYWKLMKPNEWFSLFAAVCLQCVIYKIIMQCLHLLFPFTGMDIVSTFRANNNGQKAKRWKQISGTIKEKTFCTFSQNKQMFRNISAINNKYFKSFITKYLLGKFFVETSSGEKGKNCFETMFTSRVESKLNFKWNTCLLFLTILII